MYAVIKTGGKQYRVAQGDRLRVEKLNGNVGDTVTLGEVLLVGAGDDGGTVDPIFGTTPFAYQDPGVKANEVASHGGSVEGRNCADTGCHVTGGAAAGKLWVFAGTVYSTAQGGAVVPKAEVRVVGPDGTEVGSAYTDENGNFWFEKDGATIPANSKVGVRREGGKPMQMATLLQPDDRGCSANRANCHGTAATGRVYAP